MSQIIDSLSSEETKKLEEYRVYYTNQTFDTTPTNRKAAEDAFQKIYEINGYLKKGEKLKVIWTEDMFSARQEAAKLRYTTKNPTPDEIRNMNDCVSYGQFEIFWAAFYLFCQEVITQRPNSPVAVDPQAPHIKTIVHNCGPYYTLEKAVVVSDKPVAIKHDEQYRLHSAEGAAFEFKNGVGVNFIHGEPQSSLAEAVLTEMFDDK